MPAPALVALVVAVVAAAAFACQVVMIRRHYRRYRDVLLELERALKARDREEDRP